MTPRGLSVLVVCLPLASACSDADDNDCPIHIDAPTDGFVPTDAPPFPDAPPIDAPFIDAPVDDLIATRTYLALDAVHTMSLFEARIDSYLVDGLWPAGNAGFTPQATCCVAGGGFLCPDDPPVWNWNPWTLYDFSIDGEHGAVYSLAADPTQLRLTAHLDLDCDGVYAAIVLRCDRATGQTVCTMEYPPALE